MESYFENLVIATEKNCYLIAEACDNHMGSFEMAKALCRVAKSAGCDAVKFQHHIASEEMLRECTMTDNFDEHLYDFLMENALTIDQHVKLKKYCDEIRITYLCTPFSYLAAQEIVNLVPFFKIGSGEFADYIYIDKLLKLSKPILLSCGMSTHEEVLQNFNRYLDKASSDLALLHCSSEYPVDLSNLNIDYVKTLKACFESTIIGYSDHSKSIVPSLKAVVNGAQIIEKHITLSPYINGPDKDVSIGVNELTDLSKAIIELNQTKGKNKKISEVELGVRQWAYRSLVTTKVLPEGHILKHEDITSKRPGTGIPSKSYETYIGRRLKVGVDKNVQLKPEYFV